MTARAARQAALLSRADRVLRVAPQTTARWRRSIERSVRQLTHLQKYVGIYEAYTCSRTVYDDTETRRLLDDARTRGLVVTVEISRLDWGHYLRDVHLPSLAALVEAHRHPTRPAAHEPRPALARRTARHPDPAVASA